MVLPPHLLRLTSLRALTHSRLLIVLVCMC